MRPMDLLALAENFTFKLGHYDKFRILYKKSRQALNAKKSVMLAISDLGLTAQFNAYRDKHKISAYTITMAIGD